MQGYVDKFWCGDVFEMTKLVPENSIHLVMSDRTNLTPKDYQTLALTASCVLGEYGALLVRCNPGAIPVATKNLTGSEIYFQWPLIQLIPNYIKNEAKKLIRHYVVWLWYSKGPMVRELFRENYIHDLWGPLVDKGWRKGVQVADGQRPYSSFRATVNLIKAFSKPKELILNPFTDRGMVAVACSRSDRHFITVDPDDKRIERGSKRWERASRICQVPNIHKDILEQASSQDSVV